MIDNNLELFDDYINDKLSEVQKVDFENRIANDTNLKKEFNEYQLLVGGIELAGANTLKERLVKHESGYNPSTSKSFIHKIAAGLIILAAASFLVIQYGSESSYVDLYTEYYNPYPNVIDPINRSDENSSKSIFQLYESRNFNEVITSINKSEATDEELFYLSQSYLAINDFENALKNAQEVSQGSRFFSAAQWYVALIHLAKEDSASLHFQLEEIIKHVEDYEQQAKELKKDL